MNVDSVKKRFDGGGELTKWTSGTPQRVVSRWNSWSVLARLLDGSSRSAGLVSKAGWNFHSV